MGRHTVTAEDHQAIGNAGLGLPGRLALVAAGVVVVIGGAVLIGPQQAFARLPWASPPPCTSEPVNVVVTPELQGVMSQILDPLEGRKVADKHCVAVKIEPSESRETVDSAAILPIDRAPDVWIPDSAFWGSKVPTWKLNGGKSLASTPVVVATSRAAADQLGWSKSTPTWNQAIRGSRPFAVPDVETQTESLQSLVALWESQGRGPAADESVVATVLAADRGEVPAPDAALAVAQSGSANAPLLPATEQEIAAKNKDSAAPNLVAVYPKPGSPMLDYPVYTISAGAQPAPHAEAVQLVMDRLFSDQGTQIVHAAGFRDGSGTGALGDGIQTGPIRELPTPSNKDINGMIDRVDSLARPSRLLVILDASLSMSAKLSDGISRIQLATQAAVAGSQLLPDRSSAGLWAFATDMVGKQDYRVLGRVAPLGSIEKNGETHREALLDLANNPDRWLHGGGTGLYETLLEGSRYMRRTYDPKSVNAIILLTDGHNDDPNGATLQQLLREQQDARRSRQQVAIYTAGLGPDADYAALKQIADVSGGYAYRIDSAYEGQQALLDGLRRSRRLGLPQQ